jgi:hypothetical protein
LEVFCGIDWAEAHHDVALVNGEGTLIAKRRISDDAAGFAALIMLLADAGDSADDPIPVAIETSRGLLVACLRATGRKVYAINPMAVSRRCCAAPVASAASTPKPRGSRRSCAANISTSCPWSKTPSDAKP